MQLVIGLGNPGAQYVGTRHNIGFVVIGNLCVRWGVPAPSHEQNGALVREVRFADQSVLLACPQRYMNRSGEPAAALMDAHGITSGEVTVIHDDMGLPAGTVRCRRGGGHGGHNGLRDLIAHIGGDFLRVRLGIGRPPAGVGAVDHVLSRWTDEESVWLPDLIEAGSDAAALILSEGIVAAMNRFNVRKKSGPDTQQSPSQGAPEQ